MPKSQSNQHTRDFLIRDLPVELADKLKVAATLHRMSMKAYIQSVLEAHLKNLEEKGVGLTLDSKKSLRTKK